MGAGGCGQPSLRFEESVVRMEMASCTLWKHQALTSALGLSGRGHDIAEDTTADNVNESIERGKR